MSHLLTLMVDDASAHWDDFPQKRGVILPFTLREFVSQAFAEAG
jgi:hypothetical protein